MTKLWCKTVLLLYHYHYSSRPAWDGSLLPAVFHSISRPSTGWASYAFNVAFIILSHPFAMTGFIYSESVYTIILSISAFLTTSITTNILRKRSTHSRWCTLIRPTLRFRQSQADLPTTSTWGLRMTHLPKSLDSTFSTLAKMKTCIPRTNLACMNCTLNTVREASQIGGFIWDKTTHPIDLGLKKWDLGHRKWICQKFSTKRGSNMP